MIPPTDDVFGCRPNCASTVVAIVVARICNVAGLLSLPPDTGDDLLPRVVSMRSAEMVSRTFDHTIHSQSRNVHKVCLGCRCSVPREQAHSSIIAGPIPAIWCGLDSSALGIMWIPKHVPLSHTCEEAEPLIWATPVSHAVCFSRKRHNRETQKRQAMSLKLADRVAKRKLMAQPENSHAFRRTNAEKQGAKHRQAFRWCHSRQSPASAFAGALEGFLPETVRRGQRRRFVEAAEVSV